MDDVVFLNPKTCGIYKDGGTRFKTNSATGLRTTDVDNELADNVEQYLRGALPEGAIKVPLSNVIDDHVLVPTYYDARYIQPIAELIDREGLKGVSLGKLIDDRLITVRGGHGSPSNDQRTGVIPYVKVSDIRGLRININPTNMVACNVARRHWRGKHSGLEAWDLITPNRASSNIGEFAFLLPGEERIVITKEVFVLRVMNPELFDHFYLLWALSLKAVRDQWRRIALMQTNREDCGSRYREIILPQPNSKAWANRVSEKFRSYFTTIADAKAKFIESVQKDTFEYVANVANVLPVVGKSEEVQPAVSKN